MGLCGSCAHQRVIRSGRGSSFSMCERGLRREPGFSKYPRLPVLVCGGWEYGGEPRAGVVGPAPEPGDWAENDEGAA